MLPPLHAQPEQKVTRMGKVPQTVLQKKPAAVWAEGTEQRAAGGLSVSWRGKDAALVVPRAEAGPTGGHLGVEEQISVSPNWALSPSQISTGEYSYLHTLVPRRVASLWAGCARSCRHGRLVHGM